MCVTHNEFITMSTRFVNILSRIEVLINVSFSLIVWYVFDSPLSFLEMNSKHNEEAWPY